MVGAVLSDDPLHSANISTGEYQDRRDNNKVDCSQTIWILATNAHDQIIQDFSASNESALFSGDDDAEKKRLLKQLSHQIREDFRHKHGVRKL
jgi:ATP-dependent Clp protease ATP-binding subunit ClpA